MDFAAKGAEALSKNDFPAAIKFYTKALIINPSSPDYFTQRSLAFTRLSPPRYDLALKDAEYGVLLGQKRAKREKIQAAQHRRVVALYGLGQYADAKAVLQTMAKWRPEKDMPKKMEGDMWMTKIDNKLKVVPESAKVATAKEYPEIDLPNNTQMQAWLESQVKESSSLGIKGEPQKQKSETVPDIPAVSSNDTNGQSKTDLKAPAGPTTDAAPAMAKIRHEWYQNAKTVTITFYAKGVPKDSCQADLQKDSLHIAFPHSSVPSSTYYFELDPLFASIDPSQSKCKVMSTKVELTLVKNQAGVKWRQLEGTDSQSTFSEGSAKSEVSDIKNAQSLDSIPNGTTAHPPLPQVKEVAPSYPSSSRNGPKDWDKLANDLESKAKLKKKTAKAKSSGSDSEVDDEEEDNSDYANEDSVDAFFKKLYAGSDDDTRRAMMKSFYESNGTALSTNWKDVGARTVEEVKSAKE